MFELKKIFEGEKFDANERDIHIVFEGYSYEYIAVLINNKLTDIFMADDDGSGWAFGTRLMKNGEITDDMWEGETEAVKTIINNLEQYINIK